MKLNVALILALCAILGGICLLVDAVATAESLQKHRAAIDALTQMSERQAQAINILTSALNQNATLLHSHIVQHNPTNWITRQTNVLVEKTGQVIKEGGSK